MSELKVYKPYSNRDGDMFLYHKGDEDLMLDDEDEIYLKYEVDKAIAEKDKVIALLKERICNGDVSRFTWIDDCIAKDKEITELNDKLQNVSGLLKETREWLIESQRMHKRCADGAIKKIRHNKYKRCLAMADRWLFAFYATNKCNDKFYLRNLKLRELAEKFKEAK